MVALSFLQCVVMLDAVFGAINYLSPSMNCHHHLPACLTYNDGCNRCSCDLQTGRQSCTEKYCITKGTPSCNKCESGSYWLSFSTFQAPGYPSCWSGFLSVASFPQSNSKCACPGSHPYYQRGVGCVTWNYCLALLQWTVSTPSDIFVMPKPSQLSQCTYAYQPCSLSTDCKQGFICKRPTSNYEECVPLAAFMNDECMPVALTEDCMGSGYGYCVPVTTTTTTTTTTSTTTTTTTTSTPTATIPATTTTGTTTAPPGKCEVGGCSSHICAVGASRMITTCEYRCEYGCRRHQSCGEGPSGHCGWNTIAGQEGDYAQCMALCQGRIPPMLPPSVPVTPSPRCPVCRNPITKQCGMFAVCPAANYCKRPFVDLDPSVVATPLQCAAYPGAVCKFSGCGGCSEYFEDPHTGKIITLKECNAGHPVPLPEPEPLPRPVLLPEPLPRVVPLPQPLPKVAPLPEPPQIVAVPRIEPVVRAEPVLRAGSTQVSCDGVICSNPCEAKPFPGISGCLGCSAPSVTCVVEPCAVFPCCGCAEYYIKDRKVTRQCQDSPISCACLPGPHQPFCCDGHQYHSDCEVCGSCYNLQKDCTPGICS